MGTIDCSSSGCTSSVSLHQLTIVHEGAQEEAAARALVGGGPLEVRVEGVPGARGVGTWRKRRKEHGAMEGERR